MHSAFANAGDLDDWDGDSVFYDEEEEDDNDYGAMIEFSNIPLMKVKNAISPKNSPETWRDFSTETGRAGTKDETAILSASSGETRDLGAHGDQQIFM